MASQGTTAGAASPGTAAAWMLACTIAIADIGLVFPILLVLQPYLYDLNALLGSMTGIRMNFMAIFGIVAATFIGLFTFFIARSKRREARAGHAFKPSRAEVTATAAILVTWNTFYMILGNEAGGEIFIVLRFFEGILPMLYVALNGILVIVLVKLLPALHHLVIKDIHALPRSRKGGFTMKGLIAIIVALMGYGTCFALPFAAPPPSISSAPLPPKPLLIGHRGASHYAPENTIEAAQAAIMFGAVGWEVDVQVSYDGTFFLLHDDDLRRTTNIEEVFPEQASTLASSLDYSRIQVLDAGSWFADDDPYGTIASGIVPRSQADAYRGVRIPTLQEAIAFSEATGMILEIDFKSPPRGHPFHDTARNAMIAMLDASSLGKKAWVYTSSSSAANLSRLCTRSCSIDNVIDKGYDAVNLGLDVTNAQLAAYRARGITTVVYTVDSVPVFSTLWSLGVTYVKTGRPWLFEHLEQPLFRMDQSGYITSWVFFLAIGCGAVTCAMTGIRACKARVEEKKRDNKDIIGRHGLHRDADEQPDAVRGQERERAGD
ncbi:MAG: hypothetical protein GYA24_13090 [Candidatus Lokiarchaeota archaeon]|nr:hypothetical protein [Candidatus Lokiarchaeota archaeon]